MSENWYNIIETVLKEKISQIKDMAKVERYGDDFVVGYVDNEKIRRVNPKVLNNMITYDGVTMPQKENTPGIVASKVYECILECCNKHSIPSSAFKCINLHPIPSMDYNIMEENKPSYDEEEKKSALRQLKQMDEETRKRLMNNAAKKSKDYISLLIKEIQNFQAPLKELAKQGSYDELCKREDVKAMDVNQRLMLKKYIEEIK